MYAVDNIGWIKLISFQQHVQVSAAVNATPVLFSRKEKKLAVFKKVWELAELGTTCTEHGWHKVTTSSLVSHYHEVLHNTEVLSCHQSSLTRPPYLRSYFNLKDYLQIHTNAQMFFTLNLRTYIGASVANDNSCQVGVTCGKQKDTMSTGSVRKVSQYGLLLASQIVNY